jgi:hypothetical protein
MQDDFEIRGCSFFIGAGSNTGNVEICRGFVHHARTWGTGRSPESPMKPFRLQERPGSSFARDKPFAGSIEREGHGMSVHPKPTCR